MSDPLLFVDTSESNVTVTGNLNVTGNHNSNEVRGGYDTNTTSYFGRAAVGYCGHNDAMAICHIDSNNNGGYALLQEANGETMLNSASGRPVHIRQGNVDKLTINSDGVVINSGTLRNPGNPGCRVSHNSAQFTLPSGSHYPIVYNFEYHDTGNDYNTSTGLFTCPVAGKYLCIHMMTTRSSATRVAITEVKLYINTTETARQFQDTTQDSACATNVINCAAGDTLSAGIYNASASNQFNGATEYGSQFIVEFLG